MSGRSKGYSIVSQTGARPAQETTWQPGADIYRLRDGWLLKLELAGILLEDIAVSASGSSVAVSGIRRDLTAECDGCQYSMEISYSRFQRTLTLPGKIDSSSLDVKYEKGMLLIRVTK